MGPYNLAYEIREIEERRLGLDRRRFSYTCHIPERRCGQDRRCLQVKLSFTETRLARPLRVIQGLTRQAFDALAHTGS
ncbi:MAG: hypothetical protein ACOWYE_10840 [Desulfatiglandales bacterium]